MNTPESTTVDDDIHEKTQKHIDKLHTQLIQDQIRRKKGRDYGRILREYNKPTNWYQASPVTHSIYFYDPHYQRYLQQHLKLSQNLPSIRPPTQPSNQSTPSSTKHNTNFYKPSHQHQPNQILPSRLQTVPTLPPIMTHKKNN